MKAKQTVSNMKKLNSEFQKTLDTIKAKVYGEVNNPRNPYTWHLLPPMEVKLNELHQRLVERARPEPVTHLQKSSRLNVHSAAESMDFIHDWSK